MKTQFSGRRWAGGKRLCFLFLLLWGVKINHNYRKGGKKSNSSLTLLCWGGQLLTTSHAAGPGDSLLGEEERFQHFEL